MLNAPPVITICIVFLLAAAVVFAGCTGTGTSTDKTTQPASTGTPVQVSHIVVTEAQDNGTVHVKQGNYIIVQLAENPTTGYQWNLTTTPGLLVTNTSYETSDKTGKLMGAGGTRTWDITAIATGKQKITAVYGRSWEPVTGSETGFSMTVVVE